MTSISFTSGEILDIISALEEKAQQIAEFIVPRVDLTYFIDEVHRWIDMYLSSEQPQQ
jgi:hypothetical protein